MQCVSLDAVTSTEMKLCISPAPRVNPELQCAGTHFVSWVVFKPPVNTSFMLYDVVNCKNQGATIFGFCFVFFNYHKYSKFQERGRKAE